MPQARESAHLDVPDVYEPEVVNVMERFVASGDCVIDVGASIGFFTVLMSRIVGPDGLVLAFEPEFQSFKHLARNVHTVHHLDNVACFRIAAWSHDVPKLELFSLPWLGYASFHQYTDAYRPEFVEGRSLDSLLISENDHPRLIKIDCEGTEHEVLYGAQKILKRGVDCVVVEFNYNIFERTNRTDRQIRDFMASLGYDLFLINIGDGNGGFRAPIKVLPEQTIKLSGGSGVHWMNVMFSTEDKVRQRWAAT